MEYWRWLLAESSHTTGSSEASVALGSLSTPITDYSKGMTITNNTSKKLIDMMSKPGYDGVADGTTGDITHAALFNDTLYWYPTTDSTDSLSLSYFKQLTLPTDDTVDLATTPGIPVKYHPYLIDGVIAEGLRYTDDDRYDRAMANFTMGVRIMIVDNNDYFNIREQKENKSSLDRIGRLLGGQ
jgi:hypothetical protein